ncbi:MAG TPA: methyltransferase domain-containing protein [Solirubrobacteraceae bacterium]|nr:methyltransferase domain-containing protein [Solirubrobacteraceae bacterium]
MLLRDFATDEETGIALPPQEVPPAGYLDGAERYLFERLPGVSDRSTGSEELQGLVHDWPTLYHLTPYRATIFDCLGLTAAGDARVLELGAGCGAITRWLGEHCGEVHAIEGDRERARVARARCADQDNVRLYAANYSGLEERQAFELVTLIGVLEYGHLYHPDHMGDARGAALANLRIARRALTADGALVLAIENKLGLKYLNGAREDHSGRLFDSIQGYPDPAVPATFSARELDGLLREAGFGGSRWYVAHPDYKLATTIVDAAEAADDPHAHNWLDAPAPDRGAQRGPLLFNERLAQREVVRAGLTLDLANSFLVLAYPESEEASASRLGVERGWVARHYSLGRRAAFQKRATLAGGTVTHEPAASARPDGPDAAEIRARIGLSQTLRAEPYARGDLLIHRVLESIAAEGLGEGFARHVAALREWIGAAYGLGEPAEGAPVLVRGEAFDATWWNVVETAEGWVPIDEEWHFDHPLPADFVVWRNLHHFALRNVLQLPEPERDMDAGVFADLWLRNVAGTVSPELLADFAALDRAIGMSVAAGPLPDGVPALTETLRALGGPAERRLVLADAGELAADGALLARYLEAISFEDPLTLALIAPPGETAALAQRLQAGEAAAGLEADGAADVMLADAPADAAGWAQLVAGAVAVLSEAPPDPRHGDLPRIGGGDLGRLKALAA